MGDINEEGALFWKALRFALVIGAVFTGFDIFGAYDSLKVCFIIVLALGAIALFIGKIVELKWAEVGAILGSSAGLGVGVFLRYLYFLVFA